MTRGYNLRRLLLSVVILLTAVGSAYSQRPEAEPSSPAKSQPKALSYSFVSPNTRENLKLDEAVRMLNSPEETQLINAIKRLSRCLGLRPTVSRTIGSWSDGAEHSTLFRVYADWSTLVYAGARLGKLERQKSFLYFIQTSSGKEVMYILSMRRNKANLLSISRTLDKNGIEFRTLVPRQHRQTIIYVVDLKGELRKQIAAAAKELGARLAIVRGTGEFVGDDSDRDKAQQLYDQVVKEYEGQRPQVSRCAQ